MEKDTVRVWFCSPDAGFSQAIVRALGPGFEIQQTADFPPHKGSIPEGWGDAVLLDLRASSQDNGSGTGLRLLGEIAQVDLPPPVIVILAGDDTVLTRKMMESGAFDVLASPPDMVELRLLLRRAYRSEERRVGKECRL